MPAEAITNCLISYYYIVRKEEMKSCQDKQSKGAVSYGNNALKSYENQCNGCRRTKRMRKFHTDKVFVVYIYIPESWGLISRPVIKQHPRVYCFFFSYLLVALDR